MSRTPRRCYQQPLPGFPAQNLTVSSGDAITIAASGVTLNLNGFTISSTAATAAGAGIRLSSGVTDITILNGHILGGVTYNGATFSSGPGFQSGIGVVSSTTLKNVRVAGVFGVSGMGIGDLGIACVIDRCVVSVAGGVGLSASSGLVVNSSAIQCGGTAITGSVVTGCNGLSLGGKGIVANSVNSSYALDGPYNGTTNPPPQTRLLFPFVTNQNAFDTGISIANTTADSFATQQSAAGTATIYFYGLNAPNPLTVPSVAAGSTYSNDLSVIAPGFQGYLVVVCNFPLAHGGAVISTGTGATSWASPALVLPPQRSTALPEALGQ